MTYGNLVISTHCDRPLPERLKGINYAIDSLFFPASCINLKNVESDLEYYYPVNAEVTLKGKIKDDEVVLLY